MGSERTNAYIAQLILSGRVIQTLEFEAADDRAAAWLRMRTTVSIPGLLGLRRTQTRSPTGNGLTASARRTQGEVKDDEKIAVVSMIAIFTMDTLGCDDRKSRYASLRRRERPQGECFPTVAQTGRRYWEYVLPPP